MLVTKGILCTNRNGSPSASLTPTAHGRPRKSGLLHHAAAPRGSLIPAEVPLIDAEILFKDSGPPLRQRFNQASVRSTNVCTMLPRTGHFGRRSWSRWIAG